MENMPEQFPSVIDAVQDYQNTTYAIVQEISIEYSRMFQGEEENASPLGMAAPGQTTVKSQGNIYNNTHMREMREQRREKFLIEFNSSNNYCVLRQKLKRAIFRLAVEKYNKKVDHKGLTTKLQKEQFKADLYTFLQEQMKVFLNQAIDSLATPGTQMHNDLIMSHRGKNEEIRAKLDKNFKESEADKFKRLSHEYDLIQDSEHAEWYIQNILISQVDEPDKDPQRWYDYALFCLKYNVAAKAELFMNKYIKENGLNQRLNLIMGAMSLQNGQYRKAQQYLHTVLKEDWEHIQANVLMAFTFNAINRPGLSRKHFAIAKVKRMRELG